MMKWILLFTIGYFLYKVASPIFRLIKINRSIQEKKRKSDIRSKVEKMDIKDAEFEDKRNDV